MLKRFLKENRAFLHNHYGPSETHVVTALTIGPDVPPTGKPIPDPENNFLAGLREAGLSRERIEAIVKRVETFAGSLDYRKQPTAAVLFKAGLEDLGVSVTDEYSGWRKYLSRPDSLDIIAQAINHAFMP